MLFLSHTNVTSVLWEPLKDFFSVASECYVRTVLSPSCFPEFGDLQVNDCQWKPLARLIRLY